MKGESMSKLTREQKRDIAAIAAKRDADIDFSDAPPVLDWTGAEIGKFYRPMKKPVTMRLDSDIIEWLKSGGRGYQTRANWLLRHAMLHTVSRERLVSRQRNHRSSHGRQRKQRFS
ncbi:MAG TPA: BrnA antitoxin family protein [Terriglobia bacterium]|nr:BrnA antitoxin family protein [Terriglobia bacterium]